MGQRLCQPTVPCAPGCSSPSSPFSLFSLCTKRLFIPAPMRHVTTWWYCEIDGVRVALSYTGMHHEWKRYRGARAFVCVVVCACDVPAPVLFEPVAFPLCNLAASFIVMSACPLW